MQCCSLNEQPIVSYLVSSVSDVLKASLFLFFSSLSFITLAGYAVCGQQHYCPAVIPIVVKVWILKWIIYKICIQERALLEGFSVNSEKRLGLFSPDRIDMREGEKIPCS